MRDLYYRYHTDVCNTSRLTLFLHVGLYEAILVIPHVLNVALILHSFKRTQVAYK